MTPAKSQLPCDLAFDRLLCFLKHDFLPGSPAQCIDVAALGGTVHGLAFAALAPSIPAPPTATARDTSPPANDKLPCSYLDLGVYRMLVGAADLGSKRMQPWESAALFHEACEAVFKTISNAHIPSVSTWKPRLPYHEDRYECILAEDDSNTRRPWEIVTIICDETYRIRGCTIADWSATSDKPFPSGAILQSELVAGTALLHRLLYKDYWPPASSLSESSVEIRLTTFSPSTIRAVNVGLSLSDSKTTVSFTLQDHIEDAEMTASWQRLFAWTLDVPFESQHNEGDISPTGDKGEQFVTRGHRKVRTTHGRLENKLREGVAGAGGGADRNCSISDSVDWAEESTGSRVPSKTEFGAFEITRGRMKHLLFHPQGSAGRAYTVL
ncbi:hypothetical protein B0T21DRAFT_86149 [Apiosordaria backusii]|uniref:Uncharacterized protein n=1 Tax=Apiosordaria backusii TaxID=314023 RepID=A0AA40A0S8_9PEZI|nr:hypothetical protein B0T21DRAFT_86149 [Apiosordaria backusii]